MGLSAADSSPGNMFTAALHPTLSHQGTGRGVGELLVWSRQWTCWILCYAAICGGDLQSVTEHTGQALDQAHRGGLSCPWPCLIIVTSFNVSRLFFIGQPFTVLPNTFIVRVAAANNWNDGVSQNWKTFSSCHEAIMQLLSSYKMSLNEISG